MSDTMHGLSVGIQRLDDEYFVTMSAVGKLTHDDYEAITPVINAALEGVNDAHVRMFVDASRMQGWELRAAWDDLKLGLKYGKYFERVAIYGNQSWLDAISKMAAWFVPGEVRFFDTADAAMAWLRERPDEQGK